MDNPGASNNKLQQAQQQVNLIEITRGEAFKKFCCLGERSCGHNACQR